MPGADPRGKEDLRLRHSTEVGIAFERDSFLAMMKLSSRVVRYARAWMAGPDDVVEEEITIDRDGMPIPATIVRPPGMPPPLPAWVVLHGITRPGRAHAQLVRFTRSVASAGLVTIVPEVPEWRELSLAPHLTVPTVAAAVRGLRDAGIARGDQVGLVGFSFGAPHAIAATADPRVRDDIAGVCGFGGYCSLEHTLRFMMRGFHEWEGQAFTRRPDPYGRWIVAANYLTSVPGMGDARDVADALRSLAKRAGDAGVASWDPFYDTDIRRLRATVAPERQALFDLFAPESRHTALPSADELDELAKALAVGARSTDPDIDPMETFAEIEGPVHVLHGRSDHLIPFSEGQRLAASLPRAETHLTVTRLFAHSSQERFPLLAAFSEVPRFAKALSDVLTLV